MNTDKKEFVCPWCVGGGAKLWEWAANPPGAVFTLLLRKSSAGGGGDYGRRTINLDLSTTAPASIAGVIASGVAREGKPIVDGEMPAIVGRWAGDPVVLVGDYDESRLWHEIYENKTYRNISKELVAVWNDFIEIDDLKLKYRPCSTCANAAP